MTNNLTITQKASFGAETTQIANQTNYYGITSAEASKLAIDLFRDNFPKLQEEAMCVINQRVDKLIQEIVSKIEEKCDGDYTSFSDPDMQYVLIEAEKGYARMGSEELCKILSSLIADRSACKNDQYLEIILDKAIEIAPSLKSNHLDYLTLIFAYKHLKFCDVTTLDKLRNNYIEVHKHFKAPENDRIISFFNMLGLVTLHLGKITDILSKEYGFSEQEVAEYLPDGYKVIPVDYGLTPVGIVLAIFNAQAKTDMRFDLSIWIHE